MNRSGIQTCPTMLESLITTIAIPTNTSVGDNYCATLSHVEYLYILRINAIDDVNLVFVKAIIIAIKALKNFACYLTTRLSTPRRASRTVVKHASGSYYFD